MRKVSLSVVFLIALLVMATSQFAVAGPSIDEVKKNVEKLWKPIKDSQPSVTAVEFKKIMDSDKEFVLIDVRTASEYSAGHLPGAINIQRGLVEWVTPKMVDDTDEKIYVYCRTGARAAFVVQRLTQMGYTDVTNIYDSFKGWVEAGYPVYNRHGEFVLTKGGFEMKDPRME